MELLSALSPARPGAIMRGGRRPFLVAVVAALLAALAAPLSAMADMPMTGEAEVCLVDLSSGAQTADFYVDGVKCWSGVVYKTVSNYTEVSP